MHASPPRLALLALAAVTLPAVAGPPPTRVEPVTETIHGETIVDDYRWLEALEAESDAVRAWTTKQNDYTRGILDALPGREKLEARLDELMTIGSVSAPVMRLNRYFYTERTGEQNQPVLFMRVGPDGAPFELLDPNTLDDRGLYALDWFEPNHDGTLIAFGLSHAGDEMSVLHVLDVDDRAWRADEIAGKVDFGGWAPDGRSFLYSKLTDPDDAYSRTFFWHELGRHWREDPLLFEQSAPSRIPGAQLSRDGRWIIVTQFEGWSKQDLYVVDVNDWKRTGVFAQVPIAEGLNARFEAQEIHGDTLYLFTTLDAPNGMIYRVDLNDPERANWRVTIPEDDGAVLTELHLARGQLVATYEKDATTRIRRFGLDGAPHGRLELPGLGTASITTSPDRVGAFLRFTSFNEPPSIYHVDLVRGTSDLWARPDVPVDPTMIVVKQEWATSADGTKVPMFIVHRKGLRKDGTLPTLLYGYGGFNVSLTPSFNATRFPWLEAGGVYVLANLRGGGEYGEAWHQAGMLGNKQNVYDDLYACAEHLIEAGYTSSDHLVVMGGSNGGLLTGVAATQRPDLFNGVISAVPLLDMIRFPGFLMAKFWVPEYGDPEKSEDFAWIRAYSPYHNIESGRDYPSVLFTAGENDNRVHPMHARKMAAAMQARAGNDLDADPILLWVDREGGHGQGKPRHLRVRDSADIWSFIMWRSGMTH